MTLSGIAGRHPNNRVNTSVESAAKATFRTSPLACINHCSETACTGRSVENCSILANGIEEGGGLSRFTSSVCFALNYPATTSGCPASGPSVLRRNQEKED
jgi:hypothetical protein